MVVKRCSSIFPLRYTPVGVMFLVAGKLVKMDDIEEEFRTLGWYIMTVLLGLFIHGFVVLPVIYALFTRKNPFLLIMHMGQALATALGTASRLDMIRCSYSA